MLIFFEILLYMQENCITPNKKHDLRTLRKKNHVLDCSYNENKIYILSKPEVRGTTLYAAFLQILSKSRKNFRKNPHFLKPLFLTFSLDAPRSLNFGVSEFS